MMVDFKRLKRRLIGGMWVKHNDKESFNYCVRSHGDWLSSYNLETQVYTGFGITNVGIERLEDYGAITVVGKYLGYSDRTAKKRGRVSVFDHMPFDVGIIMALVGTFGVCHYLPDLLDYIVK